MRLLLASTSVYRRELLARLRLPFESRAPDTDETPHPDELPAARAARLAAAKAEAVCAGETGSVVVIGSDQVAAIGTELLRKPRVHAAAVAQLQRASGCCVDFYTAVRLIRQGTTETREVIDLLDHTRVEFRVLTPAEIERYLQAEQPYDCAGSFKCEGLGISLFRAIHSSDPTALIGLPMIGVSATLRNWGWCCP